MAIKTLPVTEARNRFLKMIKETDEAFARFVITKKGKPVAVLMSCDDYEGWLETLEIMSDPDTMKGLKQAEKEFKEHKFIPYEEAFGRPHKKRARRK